jgi:hypothetical protein
MGWKVVEEVKPPIGPPLATAVKWCDIRDGSFVWDIKAGRYGFKTGDTTLAFVGMWDKPDQSAANYIPVYHTWKFDVQKMDGVWQFVPRSSKHEQKTILAGEAKVGMVYQGHLGEWLMCMHISHTDESTLFESIPDDCEEHWHPFECPIHVPTGVVKLEYTAE